MNTLLLYYRFLFYFPLLFSRILSLRILSTFLTINPSEWKSTSMSAVGLDWCDRAHSPCVHDIPVWLARYVRKYFQWQSQTPIDEKCRASETSLCGVTWDVCCGVLLCVIVLCCVRSCCLQCCDTVWCDTMRHNTRQCNRRKTLRNTTSPYTTINNSK